MYDDLDDSLRRNKINLTGREKIVLKKRGSVPHEGAFLSAHKLRTSPVRLIRSALE